MCLDYDDLAECLADYLHWNEASLGLLLREMGNKFAVTDPELDKYIEEAQSNDDPFVSFSELYKLAKWFDDGHGLTAVEIEMAFTGTRPGYAGGRAIYVSDYVDEASSTSQLLETWAALDAALRADAENKLK